MARDVMTVRIEAGMRAELDSLARLMERDRTFLINEAIGQYLAVHRWQFEHLREGVRQAEAGEFASDKEVAAVLGRGR